MGSTGFAPLTVTLCASQFEKVTPFPATEKPAACRSPGLIAEMSDTLQFSTRMLLGWLLIKPYTSIPVALAPRPPRPSVTFFYGDTADNGVGHHEKADAVRVITGTDDIADVACFNQNITGGTDLFDGTDLSRRRGAGSDRP